MDHLETAFQGAEVVFHMAAPDSSINNHQLHYSVNVQGTFIESNCFFFYYLSSMVYAKFWNLIRNEECN